MDQKKNIKPYLLVVTYGLALYFIITNIQLLSSAILKLLSIITPFLLAVAFAFVLNLLMRFLENKPIAFIEQKTGKPWGKVKRPVSITLTFIFVILFITAIVQFVVPQLSSSIKTLVSNMPIYIRSVQTFIDNILQEYQLTDSLWEQIALNWNEIVQKAGNLIANLAPRLLDITVNVTTSIFNLFTGLMVSIYLLAGKEKLIRNCKRLCYAFMPRKAADKTVSIGSKVNKTLGDFISGQMIEACILGTLCFIGMSIFKMPYALLISVFVGITALIPIFGAYIGVAFGAFIILMIKPITALWFIIFIICLQQFEGNVIYPRVVGNSIGLDGLWVIFALIVGGSLFGLPGMLLGIPLFAVAYSLVGGLTQKRLKKKGLEIHTQGLATEETYSCGPTKPSPGQSSSNQK